MPERISPRLSSFNSRSCQMKYPIEEKTPNISNGFFHITSMELLVLQGLSDGLLYNQLAGKLSLSVHTIKNHIRNMMERVRDREIIISKARENILRLITLAINDERVTTSVHGVIPDDLLTNREWEIVKCMMEGLDSKQIAALFKTAIQTVKNQKKNIYKKLNERRENGTEICRDSNVVAMAAKAYKERGELQGIVDKIFGRAAKHKVQ